MEKLRISRAILVEGKYDKILLERFVDANIFTTDGFSIFSSEEKLVMLSKIAERQGLIVLTDSDPAGFVIRNKLKGMLPKNKLVNIYAPCLFGKEKRKNKPSKSGILGVEGLEIETLRNLFERSGVLEDTSFTVHKACEYTKAYLYEKGYCGKENSASIRDTFCKENELPLGMTPNAFLEAVNILGLKI